MATFLNDLRLKEIATGDEDGTWGDSNNTNLSLIADAFSYGTTAFTADADKTFTMPDFTADATRSLYLKLTSDVSLTATRTATLGPNTVSKVWIIENATSGGQSITVAQGTGATVTIAPGRAALLYSDGAGAGAAVRLAKPDVDLTDQVNGTLAVTNGGTGVTTSTGTGATVRATSPALTTPNLGTPSAATLTNATGLPVVAGTTGTLTVARGGTGVTTSTGSGSVVLASSPALTTPSLGTPSAATLTNATGLPISGGTTGTLPSNRGGTGNSTYLDGQLLIGNGTTTNLQKSTLTAGANISITNAEGSITIASTSGGTVTGVSATSPLASSGGSTPDISLSGTVAVANGGTGSTTTSGARTNLGLATVTEAEAKAGTSTTTRAWTAQRVAQAVAVQSSARLLFDKGLFGGI